MPMRERVNSFAGVCCIFSKSEGTRDRVEILFKANLQQVCKFRSKRG